MYVNIFLDFGIISLVNKTTERRSDVTRLEANRQILKILDVYVEAYPNQRFNQLLQNLEVVISGQSDQFYEESTETLKRLMNNTKLNYC